MFSPLSGQTHLLDIVTGQVLQKIMEGSPNFSELRFEVSHLLEVEDDDQVARTVIQILDRLEVAGLVEPIS